MSASSNRDTIKLLCKSIVNRLENGKSIAFPPRLRQIVQDEITGLIGSFILTDQDLREKALAKVGAKASELEGSTATETEQYRAAKAVVKSTFGDDELNGFYFQKPLRELAKMIAAYLMRSSHIDEVYETDEDLERMIVEITQKFNPADLH